MENNLRPLRGGVSNLIRLLIFAGVILLISLLFPDQLQFKYQYEKRQPWRYDKLEAPFDFPILKADEELQKEREEVLAELSPVYVLEPAIATQAKARFVQAFEKQLNAPATSETFKEASLRPDRYRDYALAFLDRIYARGIIDLASKHDTLAPEVVLTLLKGNEVQKQTLENILRVADASEMIVDTLPHIALKEPEFLLPLLQAQLRPNLFYSAERTQQLRDEALRHVSPSRGLVQHGDLIVARDDMISDDVYQKLYSFEQAYAAQVSSQRSYLTVYLGYLLLTTLIISIFALYLRRFAMLVYSRPRKLLFILSWIVLYSYLVYLVKDFNNYSIYLLPFSIVPIIIKTFYNGQLALFTHIVVVLITSFLSGLGYEFTFLQILAGTVIVLSDFDPRNWGGFFTALAFIFVAYALGYLGLSLTKEGLFQNIDWSIYPWLFLNAFLTLLAYPMIPLTERLFGFLSPITLTELSDMNRPLLRELALRAPGTLQHSLQVGNLAEAAARRIKADPLLVKVAALYHDIGKVEAPEYFIENQSGENPHDHISPQESAEILISHVTEGAKMARKAGLPAVLIDFILTHHGKTRAEFFYRKYKDACENLPVGHEAVFRYPGPLPRSKEESILMLADSVEAACKSLEKPTQEELYELIDKIIDSKRSSGQLAQSMLSFRELEECRTVFRQIMKSVHHVRVAYPEEEE